MGNSKNRIGWGMLAASILAVPASAVDAPRPGVDWPQFRGIDASGVTEGSPLPTTWNVETNENILWKTPIPGMGHASPIVWGDRVYVVTAVSSKGDNSLKVGLYGDIVPVEDVSVHKWFLYALDKKTGRIVWEQLIHEGVPSIKRHTKATQANSTPATDGRHIVAFYGSEGLCCYDMDGKLLWKKVIGNLDAGYYMMPQAQWGFGSSPIIHEGRAIVQCDVQKLSFLAAFDVTTGEEVWRTPREDVPTWSTPALWKTADRTQIVLNGYKRMGGYDAKTGAELWRMSGLGDIPVPTPLVTPDHVYIAHAHGMAAPIFAIKPTATGDISLPKDAKSSDHVAWSDFRCGVYMQTPLIYGNELYCCRDNGSINCYNPKTGEMLYQKRLGTGSTGFTASAVAGDGKVYFTSETGDIHVVKAGATFELLSKNPMGEVCMATPAISEGLLYFRTQGHLVAVGGKPASGSSSAATAPPVTGDGEKPGSAGDKPAQIEASPRVAFEIGRDGDAWGTIVFELDPQKAPITAANFLRYVDEGYFDGTILQRVLVGDGARIQIFQGGGYTALGQTTPKPGQRAPIKLETRNGLSNVRGTIAMARDSDPDTATSEFFVNLADNTKLDYTSDEKPGYAVFGHLVEGWDVVEKIKSVETETNPDPVLKGEKSQPLKPPVLIRARRQGGTSENQPK